MKIKKIEPKEINFIVRVLPGGEEYEVSALENMLARELFECIVNENLVVVTLESGETIRYQMINKEKRLAINIDDSLKNNGITEGSTILIMPNLLAG